VSAGFNNYPERVPIRGTQDRSVHKSPRIFQLMPGCLGIEFYRIGYNSRTFLFDPNGSCVASANGAISTVNFQGSAAYPVFYDAYGERPFSMSSTAEISVLSSVFALRANL